MGNVYQWYQFRGFGGEDVWFEGPGPIANEDQRVFFRIAETEQLGYLADISGDRTEPWGSLEEIKINETLYGAVTIKSDQIVALTASHGEMSVQTRASGTLTGGLQALGNYRYGSFTMGPCLVTRDAVIPLIRTNKSRTITLSRVSEMERPSLLPELIYWDRAQLEFRLPDREAIGHFDERIHDSHIQFAEQSLGWMRISIPQIKRLTLDAECREAPVVIDTFVGNAFRGVCLEQFNISGTMISFDRVKSLVLEAFEREVPVVTPVGATTIEGTDSQGAGAEAGDARSQPFMERAPSHAGAGNEAKLDDSSPECFDIEVTLRNGEVLKGVQMACGPRGWSAYVASIQYTMDLDVIKNATYGPTSGRTIGFSKIARMKFLDFSDDEKAVIAVNNAYRHWVRKANVELMDGNRLENVYILDICYLTTPLERMEMSKIDIDTMRFAKRSASPSTVA